MSSVKQFNYKLLHKYGEDVFISGNVEIRRPNLVEIGAHVAIDSGFYLTTAARIGSYVHISPYVTCIGGADAILEMGDFTTLAAGVRLIVLGDEHLGAGLVGPVIPDPYKDRLVGGKIKLEKFAAVGTSSILMPGVTMAEGSVLGAGSLLNRDTEPWTIYVGTPAQAIKKRDSKKMIEFANEIEKLNPH
jgi:acetyltransferase-like isoleucine patch superfamily enzyme